MIIKTDDYVYNPLGGASYIFKDSLLKYIHSKLHKNKLLISIGAQPNSSPHFGTLCVFSLAFALASELKLNYRNLDVSILFEVVDTAPSEQLTINNVNYQKSLKSTGVINDYMPQFEEILEYLSQLTGILYKIRYQSEFNKQKEIPVYIKKLIEKRQEIAKYLDPKNENLRIRSACPQCGLADKNSINNTYSNEEITCICPIHGKYSVNIDNESEKMEYNTPTRNLIRAIVYGDINCSKEYDCEIIRITGADYAGFYQEELLYKVAAMLEYDVSKFPIILYCPLITDWSGAKLSKTLYIKHGAYSDLPKYLINYEFLKEERGIRGLRQIYKICEEWIKEPYKLFRNYSIYYFMYKFEKTKEGK